MKLFEIISQSAFDENADLVRAFRGFHQTQQELFDRVMQRNDVKKNLDRLDIKPENRVDLFSVLDSDGGGSLSLTEILKGQMGLIGSFSWVGRRRTRTVHQKWIGVLLFTCKL